MADEINVIQGFDPNRPRLKKVKRPIKRIAPQSPSMQSSPFNSEKVSTPVAKFNNDEVDFNIDSISNTPIANKYIPNQSQTPSSPHFIEEEELNAEYGINKGELPAFLNRNMLILLACCLFAFGFLIAKLFFADQKIVRNGLQGVVMNPEVPQGRARCGIAEKTQGCVLYIMNPQRQELNARDFYDLASQLTGRQRFVIETGNMRYSNVKVRPGDIVQLNIPPL